MTIKEKLKNGFLASLFAIAINTMALKAAHLFAVGTEAGGVLRLRR